MASPKPKPFLRYVPTILNTIGWICVVAVAVTIDDARPRKFKTDIFFGVHRRRSWDQDAVSLAFWLIVLTLLVSVVSLLLRPKNDSAGPSKSSIVLAALSLGGLVAHLLKFS